MKDSNKPKYFLNKIISGRKTESGRQWGWASETQPGKYSVAGQSANLLEKWPGQVSAFGFAGVQCNLRTQITIIYQWNEKINDPIAGIRFWRHVDKKFEGIWCKRITEKRGISEEKRTLPDHD